MPNPLDEAISDEDDLTLNRVMTLGPKEITDEDILKMVKRFRRERATFIEAGEKRPRKGDQENGEELPSDA